MTAPNDTPERRLAAILAIDMVGFSGLMEADEEGTLVRQRQHRRELIDPLIKRYHGRIVKTTGDGLLVEYVSGVDAVLCGIAIQESLAAREQDREENRRIRYRIGINLGDVIVEDGDIYGDGVNIAARLESLCAPGGLCISDVVHQSVDHKLGVAFQDLGAQEVKNISRSVRVWQWTPDLPGEPVDRLGQESWDPDSQEIRFTTTQDGVRIAYASVGSGPPLVKAPNWMTHLEYDWRSPIWRHLMQELSRGRTLVRFDQRGTGLSDRDPEQITHELFVSDLAQVIDAVGLSRFPLLGISQGCAISIRYAASHPNRVTGLILYGGYAQGRRKRGSTAAVEEADAQRAIIKHGWGKDDPGFRQFFTNVFMPDATPDQAKWFNELMRTSTSPDNAVRIRTVNEDVDVVDLLPTIDVPALVLHARDDGMVPFDQGRLLASLLPQARFIPLEGRNHLLLEDEPSWSRFVDEVQSFLEELDD